MLLITILVFGTLISTQNVIGAKLNKKRRNMATRIIGGDDASPNEFPFVVELYLDGNPSCGGAIISDNYVVTAAHCTKGYEAQYIQAVAGDHNLKEDDGSEQVGTVVAVIDHEKYTELEHFNDISLLKVDPPFKLNEFVKPIALAGPDYVASGQVTIIGWGISLLDAEMRPIGNGSDKLQKVTLPIADHAACKESYKLIEIENTDPVKYIEITKNQICAGYLDRDGKDACQGDSGGPLFSKIEGKWVLAGVTSFGAACALQGYPGIYTEVAKYSNWIVEHVDTSSKSKISILKG